MISHGRAKDYKLRGLTQRKCILSLFWGPEIQHQDHWADIQVWAGQRHSLHFKERKRRLREIGQLAYHQAGSRWQAGSGSPFPHLASFPPAWARPHLTHHGGPGVEGAERLAGSWKPLLSVL